MRRKQLMVVSWTKATLVRCSRSAKTHINTCNAKKNREKGRTKKKKKSYLCSSLFHSSNSIPKRMEEE